MDTDADYEQMPEFIQTISRAWQPAPVGRSKLFKDTQSFKDNAEPIKDKDYSWAWDFAEAQFDRLFAISKELDEKANDIIKYLGGGTGLFALAMLSKIEPENFWLLKWTIPSFALAIVSILFAVLVRKPTTTYTPPSVEAAFKYVGYFEDANMAKGAFLGQWNRACVGVSLTNEIKADRVFAATWFFFLAITSLAIPIGVATWWH